MKGTAFAILATLACANAFIIIPDELPTLLSVVYSNIPPIKLGFDSRFGFGFRLGPHADFQTLIEIGPQENTRPIGMEGDNPSKRQSISRASTKRYRAPKKAPSEKTNNDTVPQLTLADILFGRSKPWKQQPKSYVDEIEFKKVPGIDDVKKSPAPVKSSNESSNSKKDPTPTKIVIFR